MGSSLKVVMLVSCSVSLRDHNFREVIGLGQNTSGSIY